MPAVNETAGTRSRFPSRRLAIVTCMDCRIDAFAAFGIELGEAHLIRNAGGVVTDDTVRSLVISKRALRTEEAWVVQHTGCGLIGLDDEAFLAEIEAETGARPGWVPGGFEDLEESVARGLGRLASEPALGGSRLRGFVLNIETGELSAVASPVAG